MRKKEFFFVFVTLLWATVAWAQPFRWPAEYVSTVTPGGNLSDGLLGEGPPVFNPVLGSSPFWNELVYVPPLVYRDWIGSRSYRNEDGTFNLFFAKDVTELAFEQDFIVTLREGWRWSDGMEITADDAMAAYLLRGHPEIGSDMFHCSRVEGEAVVYQQLGRYQYRITLPRPTVNALAAKDCGFVPAHVFMPVYEREGTEGVRQLWGEGTDLREIVSGGPYVPVEVRPDERLVFERNPYYGDAVQAADGSPLPGPDRWVFWLASDRQALNSLLLTGQVNIARLETLDQLRAVQEGIARGQLAGTLYTNVGTMPRVDFITYNFNHTDACKRQMFRNVAFRQAIAIMIDRQALIETALGGLGFPAKDWVATVVRPFHSPHLEPFPFDPDRGLELLASIGFNELGSDGVLRNPETGCRAEFQLLVEPHARATQQALVIAQTLEPYGVKVVPREAGVNIVNDAVLGQGLPRRYDSEAVLWGLWVTSIDNPSGVNVATIGANLNAWNKSTTEVEPWELLLDRLSRRMDATLELDGRVEIYNERAELMREYLPITPLISPAFSIYLDVANVWPVAAIDATSSGLRPGNYRQNLMAPQSED